MIESRTSLKNIAASTMTAFTPVMIVLTAVNCVVMDFAGGEHGGLLLIPVGGDLLPLDVDVAGIFQFLQPLHLVDVLRQGVLADESGEVNLLAGGIAAFVARVTLVARGGSGVAPRGGRAAVVVAARCQRCEHRTGKQSRQNRLLFHVSDFPFP